MVIIAQERLACRHRPEDAGFAFVAETFVMPHRRGTRQVILSERCVLRLSQTTSYHFVGAKVAKRL
jgi:hypothetical protein